MSSHGFPVLVAGALAAIAAGAARADVVQSVGVNGTLTAASSWADTAAGQTPTAISGNPGTTTAPAIINNLASNPASTYTFSDTFAAPNGSFQGFQISDSTQGQGPEAIGFLDSYVITIPTSVSNASIFSLNLSSTLGLSDLTMRLYDYSSANGYQINSTGAVSNAQLVDNWSLSNNASGSNPVASSTLSVGALASGTYVLEVAGLETGSQSGTYSGQLNVTPVPLPATAWLVLSGIGGFGWFARQRRERADRG
jgi:hypothetical protein